ncbi:MAG TPA: EscU/YscU/HrcU family type III secretion system export apparatus switch protein [Candidatus Acidoferrales bacterium]|nr:EscU/YscU/HrcU family type III secretion system export apparatus switch protein [Candidatus Acidoferrales bacterium]
MSDAEKPFEATPARIAKAKREGNVARSGELSANAAFAAAIGGCIAVAVPLGTAAQRAIAGAATGAVPAGAVVTVLTDGLVPLAAAAVAGALTGVAQSGGAAVAPSVKLQRLSPLEGLKRTLSRETAAHSLRGSLAFAIAAAAMLPPAFGTLTALLRAEMPSAAAAAVWAGSQRAAMAACAVGAAFAVAEHAAARRSWLRKLRMSFEERKREVKEQEGDPFARGRRRALARSLLRGSLGNVRKAAFVVANPTHVAVALEYDPPQVPVPRVVVRAAEAAALRVRAVAAAHGVPVVENVLLARALYDTGAIGQPIPHALYVAVAEIVAALLRSGALRS